VRGALSGVDSSAARKCATASSRAAQAEEQVAEIVVRGGVIGEDFERGSYS